MEKGLDYVPKMTTGVLTNAAVQKCSFGLESSNIAGM